MADYIDREAVCKRLVEAADVQRKAKSREFAAGMMGAQGVVWMFPTAENVVEVVRCRECRYSREPNRVLRAESIACAGVLVCCVGFDHVYPTPDDGAIFVDADGFCSQGQRREGGDA